MFLAPQADVTFPQGDSAFATFFFWCWCGVFSNLQEIEERYYAEVRHPSVVPGEVVLTSNLIDCRYWNRQLELFRRVVVAKLF